MDPKINIAVLAPYQVYPARSGGQKAIDYFYRYLSPLLPVTMISTMNNEFPPGSAVHFLPLLPDSRLRYINPKLFFVLRKEIRKSGITHLVIEHPYYGWLGILLKKACKIKLVVRSHNIEAIRFKSTGKWWWPILSRYEKHVHQNADINFFITDEDREVAIREFKLSPDACHTITYGVETTSPPSKHECTEARNLLEQKHGIISSEKILFFNGSLDYKPNLDALEIILKELNPRFLARKGFYYKIIICGRNLPADYAELLAYKDKNIIYAGFVDDISKYFKAADYFINPVQDGGGIKTKLVEALGYNLNCVSTKNGAIGVPINVTGGKLEIVPNGHWEQFTNAIFDNIAAENIPQTFFNHFYWGNIAAKAAKLIELPLIQQH